MLNANNSKWSILYWSIFFFPSMRRMISCNNFDCMIIESLN